MSKRLSLVIAFKGICLSIGGFIPKDRVGLLFDMTLFRILYQILNPENAFGIFKRRRRSATGKARKQFWQQEYWNISMSNLISVTQLGTSRFRSVALIFRHMLHNVARSRLRRTVVIDLGS